MKMKRGKTAHLVCVLRWTRDMFSACAHRGLSACHVDERSNWVVNMSTAAQRNNNEEPGLHGTFSRRFLRAATNKRYFSYSR